MTTTPLSDAEITLLRRQHPSLPDDYCEYMKAVGWGEAASGRMIYSGPVDPEFVYGPDRVKETIILLGDNQAGYCLGYHLQTAQYGEVTPQGVWDPAPESNFRTYVRAAAKS